MREWRLRLGSKEIPISRSLQDGKPQTFIDGGGTRDSNRWQSQEIGPEQLREYKEIRESGGAIASILEIKSLLTFGGGVEYHAEEGAKDWLEERIPPSQLTLFSIQAGTDAYTYPAAPAEIVETRGGDFSHIECVEPFTIIPETDNHGDIVGFKQIVKVNGSDKITRLDEDEIAYLVLIRSNGRDKTGVSLLERNRSEVENYLSTREAVENSVQLHGFPQRQIKVGREGMSPPNDNELRRIRQRFDRAWTELTMFVTGRDVEIETLEATDFDFQGLTEDSLKTLMLAFMLPQEAANIGSDGLGSGMPAELRKNLLEAETNARQNDFAGQLQRQLIGPILDEYSPYSSDDLDRIEFLGPDLDAETKDELDRLEQKLSIGQQAADAGLDATFEGDDVSVEDGEFEESQQGQGGLDDILNEKAESAVDSQLEGRELAEIPNKYVEGTGLSEDDFVPNEDILDVIEPTLEFIDEHGLPNPDDQREGAARINQFKDHIENNEPMAPEFWREIKNFHARHREQGNDDCDESSLPEEATEIDNSKFDKCHFDNGWFSDRTWGSDPALEQAERIVEAIEDTEGVELSADQMPTEWQAGGSGNSYSAVELEDTYLSIWKQAIATEETDRQLLGFSDSQTPEFVKEQLRDTLFGENPIFSDIEGLQGSDLTQLRLFMEEELVESDGWTIDGVADRLMDLDVDLSRDRAELIARTETAATLNSARETGYEEQGLAEDEEFYWTGVTQAQDDRTTDACDWLIKKTNPNHGGTPVSLSRLEELIAEAPTHDDEMQDNLARPKDKIVHPQERKTWVRHVG